MQLMRAFARVLDGRVLCLVLALGVLAAPLSGEAVARDACAAAHLDEHHAEAGDGHQGHDGRGDVHHAHGCGSCHVHLLATRAAPPPVAHAVGSRIAPAKAGIPGSAPAGPVYHPPRI